MNILCPWMSFTCPSWQGAEVKERLAELPRALTVPNFHTIQNSSKFQFQRCVLCSWLPTAKNIMRYIFFNHCLHLVHVPLIPRSGIHYTELSLLCDGTQVQDSEALALKHAISLKHARPHGKTTCMFCCRCSCLHTWNLFASSLHSFSCFAFSGRTTWMLSTMAACGLLNDET